MKNFWLDKRQKRLDENKKSEKSYPNMLRQVFAKLLTRRKGR